MVNVIITLMKCYFLDQIGRNKMCILSPQKSAQMNNIVQMYWKNNIKTLVYKPMLYYIHLCMI